MAIPAWFLGKLMPIIGGPVFSILIGILVASLLKDGKKSLQPGINFVSKKVLQYAVEPTDDYKGWKNLHTNNYKYYSYITDSFVHLV